MKKLLLYILTTLIIGTPLAWAVEPVFTTFPSYEHQGNKQWLLIDTAPGQTINDSFKIQNLSSEPISVNIEFYETTGSKEKITILENREFKNLGQWTTLQNKSLSLDPFQTAQIGVQFKIPQNTKSGEYQGVILVSNLQPDHSDQLNIETRLGNRVYLNVKPNTELQTNSLNTNISPIQIGLIIAAIIGIVISLSLKKNTNEN